MAEGPHVEVSLRDIYDLVLETKQQVAVLQPVVGVVGDHEARLRRAEKALVTVAVVLTTSGGAALKIMGA